MKRKYNIQLIFNFILLAFVIFLPSIVMAQPGGGDPNPDAPIDGGLSLLIAAGAAYGVKKYREGKKNGEQDIEK